jgi:Bacterial membrane protein YfhO
MRHSNCVIWLLILFPVAALFAPVLITDRSFAMRDAAHFYHPLFEWSVGEWGAGRVPLWNPDENCGVPVLADASSSVFYPGKLLFALPLEFTLCYKVYVIGHIGLAAVGSHLLARHWKSSQVAAGAAALAYACGGNVVFQYCNVVFLVGAAWLPFAMLAADKMLQGQSWRAALALSVVLSLMILGGEPQAAYHALLMTGLYAVVLARTAKADDGGPAAGIWQRWRGSLFVRRILLIGLAAVAGFLLSAIQVLPSSEASKESERAAYRQPRSIYEVAAFDQPLRDITEGLLGQPDPTTHHERAYHFSVGPWRYAELIWPNVSGRMFSTNRRWLSLWPAEGGIWTPTLYMGLLPFLLAVAQLRLRGGDPRIRWLSWLVVLFTLGSLGWYGLGWAAREFCSLVLRMDTNKFPVGSQVGGVYWLMTTLLPEYVNFRYPGKLLVVSSLALSQLAACGWDRLFAEERRRFVEVLKWLGGVSAVLLAIAWGAATWLNSILAPGSKDSPLKERLTSFLRHHADGAFGPFDWSGSSTDVQLAFLQTSVVCVTFVWLLHKAWKEPLHESRWQLAALLVVALDLAFANHWLVPTAPAAIWRDPPAAARLMDSGKHPRVLRGSLFGWQQPGFRQTASSERISELAQWERDTLFPKYGLPHGIALVESYGSLKSAHYESLLLTARGRGPSQPGGGRLPAGSTLRLLGTDYLMLPETYLPGTPDKLFAEKVPAKDPPALGATLWKMKSPLPRAWIVHHVETLPPLTGRLDLDVIDARATDILFPLDPLTNQRTARNFRTTAVVEADEVIDLMPSSNNILTGPPLDESCRIVFSEPTRVEIEVALARPGLVVLSDTHAPGWVALLQSAEEDQAVQQEVRIHRANRVFRGVVVPAGRHLLTFEYRPATFYRGAAVSACSWLAMILLAAFLGWRRDAKSKVTSDSHEFRTPPQI